MPVKSTNYLSNILKLNPFVDLINFLLTLIRLSRTYQIIHTVKQKNPTEAGLKISSTAFSLIVIRLSSNI